MTTYAEYDHWHTTRKDPVRTPIVWRNVILLLGLHVAFLYSFYSFLCIRWLTLYFTVAPSLFLGMIGITAGAHRLWSHRSYKAKLPLRIFLMLCHTLSLQNDLYEWCRDHRAHHKFSETDADPHNARRGFFFAHMGWLMVKKHPDVKTKGANIDLSDLEQDPVVMFQRRHYKLLVLILWLIIPTMTPYVLFNESLWHAFFTCVIFRYVFTLHSTWFVNSAAHLQGIRPYEKNIEPRENEFVIFCSFGEGYHNFHHAFPWDYSTSEHGFMINYNITTMLIDIFAWIGQVKDRKAVSQNVVNRRSARTGDGHPNRRHAATHQLAGFIVGTFCFWFPTSQRILFNYFTGRHLLA